MPIDMDMSEIYELFAEESAEGLDVMETGLLSLNCGEADPEIMNAIFRAAHSIKGGGATFGFMVISDFAHHVETLLDEIRQGTRQVTQDAVDLLLKTVDCMRDMLEELKAEGESSTKVSSQLQAELETMMAQPVPAAPKAPDSSEPATPTAAVAKAAMGVWKIEFRPDPAIFQSGNDPLRLFRELAELGELEVKSHGCDAIDFAEFDPQLCAVSWELQLRTDAGEAQIREIFAWVQDECELDISAYKGATPVRQNTGTPCATSDTEVDKPAKPPATAAPKAPKANAGSTESSSIRVNIDKVDALINLVGELVITQSMLSRFGGPFDVCELEVLREGLVQLSRNTRDLQESVMRIRMLPISVAFSRFPRLVRDMGNKLGKKVDLRLSGEATEVDKTVLEKIGDPLVHLVRNSLDHGLETAEDRLAAGKSETGVLQLNAYHEGGTIVIEVIDDGAGINQQKVLEKARERELIGPDEVLTDESIANLIFMAGFSTVDKVSDLSGRGVGMDVVRRNIQDLGGHVYVSSEPGKGSKFTIRLPLTLAILDGQLIQVAGQTYIIPLISMIETVQVTAASVNAIAGQSELFRLRDEYIPIIRLHKQFGIAAPDTDLERGLLVVVEAAGRRAGVFVDDLLEQQQIVIKSLESNYRQVPGISAATILGDGTVALIVDVPGLMQLFLNEAEHNTSASAA